METKKITRTFKEKLLAFQTEVDTIKKDATNPHFKNTYASLVKILESVKPILNAFGLVMIQPVHSGEVKTIILDSENNESVESGIQLPTGLTPQQIGSAVTYYRRYTLSGLLALEIDDDDDGQKASEAKPIENEKPWLNKYTNKTDNIETDNWKAVVDSLGKGYTVQQVESKYRLSKDNKAELIQIKNNGI